jgi:hypothetical protein
VPRLSLRTERGEDRPFDRLVRLTAQVLQAPLAIVAVLEDEQVYLNARAAGEFPDLDEWQTVTGTAFAQQLARAGAVALIGDATSDARAAEDPWIKAMGLRGLAAYPIEGLSGDLLGDLLVADTAAAGGVPTTSRFWRPSRRARSPFVERRDAPMRPRSCCSTAC